MAVINLTKVVDFRNNLYRSNDARLRKAAVMITREIHRGKIKSAMDVLDFIHKDARDLFFPPISLV